MRKISLLTLSALLAVACLVPGGLLSRAGEPSPNAPPPLPSVMPPTSAPTPSPTSAEPQLRYTRIGMAEGLPEGAWKSLLTLPDGSLLLAGTPGVFRSHQEQWNGLVLGDAGPILGTDAAGRTWVLLQNGTQAAYYRQEEWQIFKERHGWLPPPELAAPSPGWGDTLAGDSSGRLWLATGMDELRYFDPQYNRWYTYHPNDIGFPWKKVPGWQGTFITDTLISKAGALWVSGCRGEGVNLSGIGITRLIGGDWKPAERLQDVCILDLEVDGQGKVYAGALDALMIYDPANDTWQRVTPPSYDGRQTVASIDLDAAGRAWVEVWRSDGSNLQGRTARFHLVEGSWVVDLLPRSFQPAGITFGLDGGAWLCSAGALYRMTPQGAEEWGRLQVASCTPAVDGAGRVWVLGRDGPGAGVYRVEKGT